MKPIWSIQLLGRLRLTCGERTVDRFRTQKAASILAYLAYHRHRSHPREALIDLIWPEAEIDSARHSLSLALSSLRHQLEPPGVPAGSVIQADRYAVELNPDAFTTDVAEFEKALRLAAQAPDGPAAARHFREATERYRGPLLPGFYDDWVLNGRSHLGERFVHAVTHLAAALTRSGDPVGALDLLRQAIGADPLREDLHAEIMRLLIACGQPASALAQYFELERTLARELNEQPTDPLRRLAQQAGASQVHATTPSTSAIAPVPESPPQSRRTAQESPLPTGTLTFLMTEIEGSTARWEREREAFASTLRLHHAVLRREFRRHGGIEVKETDDSFLIVFDSAPDALACAMACQQAIAAQAWPAETQEPKVRMGLHSGEVELEDGEYIGLSLHRVSRILAAAHGGQVLCSEAVYGLVRRDLETEVRLRDLGAYRLQDSEMPERLYQVERCGDPISEFPPPHAERARRDALPIQLTRFFGRDGEMRLLRKLLSWSPEDPPGARLVTLTGPGGTGKTRLAIETARRLVEAYPGAVWFVPLADLSDPRLLAGSILSALGEEASADQNPLRQASIFLSRDPSLLILDNFEHLLTEPSVSCGAAETVQALLKLAPNLTVMVTSRQVLGLECEHEFPVSPLATPAANGSLVQNAGDVGSSADSEMSAERVSMYDCVRLFIDRAQAVRPDFEVTSRSAPAVAEICSRLEGIPLAIELAAARAHVLTPTQMLQQLCGSPGGRFDLLVSHRRGISDRQRALRDTIDWSYRLLAPPLQQLFRWLSAFRGGFTAEAADAVFPSDASATCPVIDGLAQLRECSLVMTEEAPNGMRFRMLESLREYALEQMNSEETHEAERRHVSFYMALAEEADPHLRGERQAHWFDRLAIEHDNLRAALRHGSAIDPQIPLRLCNALWYFWSVRGHLTEGRRSLASALSAVPSDHRELGGSALRGRALSAAGALAHDQSDYEVARSYLNESVLLWRKLTAEAPGQHGAGLAQALVYLANAQLDDGAAQEALPLYEEALELYREAGDDRGAAMALSNLGVLLLERGEVDLAAVMLSESISLKRKLGNPYGLAMSLESLGNLQRSRGNADLALDLCREALEIRRSLDHRMGIAMSLNNLGHLLLETDDADGAHARLRESLDLFLELDEPRGAVEALTGLAGTAAAQNRYETAARLLGAMEAQREDRGFAPRPCERAVIKRWKSAVRAALEDAPFESAWKRGRLLDWHDAIELGCR